MTEEEKLRRQQFRAELEGADVAFNECTELVKILQTIKTKTQRRP